jgi:hypothetical protein
VSTERSRCEDLESRALRLDRNGMEAKQEEPYQAMSQNVYTRASECDTYSSDSESRDATISGLKLEQKTLEVTDCPE